MNVRVCGGGRECGGRDYEVNLQKCVRAANGVFRDLNHGRVDSKVRVIVKCDCDGKIWINLTYEGR